MDCKQCSENLTAYLDGELSAADSSQVQSHLMTCVYCSSELHSFQKAAVLVKSNTRELDLRPESWRAIQSRISVSKSLSFWDLWFPIRWRTAIAALSCLAVLAFGYLWYQQVQERNLDAYIAQYEKAREAGRAFHRAITDADSGFISDDFAVENPFIEAKAGIDLNPFRSEDR
jgi:predicted anti-sigma-YlaC factor YlaD